MAEDDVATVEAGAEAGMDGWQRVRRHAAVAYACVLAAVVVVYGVPTGRAYLMTIVVVGLAITSIGRGWPAFARVLVDWLPFTAVLVVYDISRGVTQWAGMPLHEADVARIEKALFGGQIPTVWLQQHLYTPSSVHWYDAAMTLVYTSHFLATPILAAVLWLRDRRAWMGYIRRIVVLAFAGLTTYVLFPEAPPWLAARDGLIDPVSRLSARGWMWLHLGDVHTLLEQAQRDGSNPVAAMPSLHTAFAVLVALTLARRVGARWRGVLMLYPLAMGFALVYLGEHYVLDIVAGIGYALAADWAATKWERSRAQGVLNPSTEALSVR